jgi:hypothetical protein
VEGGGRWGLGRIHHELAIEKAEICIVERHSKDWSMGNTRGRIMVKQAMGGDMLI